MDKVLLKEMTEEFIQIHAPRKLQKRTVKCYEDAFRRMYHVHPELETLQLSELTSHKFQLCLDTLEDVYAKSTINHIRAAFSRAYYYGVYFDKCTDNPIRGIELPKKASQKEVSALTAQEQEIVEKYLPQDPLGYIAEFLLYTGLRENELENLQFTDWNKRNRTINVRLSKSKSGIRTIPLVLRTTSILLHAEAKCHNKQGSNKIFMNTQGNPIKYSSLRRLCERIEVNTGIPHLTIHMLRHSFATRYLEKGGEIKALSQILGHKSVSFTMERYLHPDIDYLAAQMNIFAGEEKYA